MAVTIKVLVDEKSIEKPSEFRGKLILEYESKALSQILGLNSPFLDSQVYMTTNQKRLLIINYIEIKLQK